MIPVVEELQRRLPPVATTRPNQSEGTPLDDHAEEDGIFFKNLIIISS